MTLLSSNSTLFFKFFIPVFWLAFFGAFLTALLLSDAEYMGDIPMFIVRVAFAAFLLVGLLIFHLYVFPLKRVEADENGVVATNYFKNYRYTWDSIEKIGVRDWYFFKTNTIFLKAAGSFGRKIHFISSSKRFRKFKLEHSAILDSVYQEV